METQTNNKRIAKNTFFLYMRSLFLLVISLYTSRVTLQLLGVNDFGIYMLVAGVVQMFAMFRGSLSAASQRFITYSFGSKDKIEIKNVFSTSMTIHIIMGICIVILLESIGIWFLYNELNIPEERIETANIVMHCAIISFFISMISVPYDALINAHEKMTAFAYIGIMEGVLKLLSAVLLIFVDYDKLIIYSFFMLTTPILVYIVYALYCRKNFYESKGFHISTDKSLIKKMMSFSGWSLFGDGSMALRNQGLDIVINMFFGVTFNAAKGICNQVQNAIYQFIQNFQAAVRPQLTMSIAQKKYSRTYELIFQGSRFSFYLLTIFAIPLFISIKEILNLWLTEVPPYTVELIRWTLIYLLLDTFSRFLIHSISSTGEIRNYQIVVGVTKLFVLPISYVILWIGGSPLTGLIVNVVIEVICLFMRLRFTRYQIKLDIHAFLTKVILRCIIVYVIAFILPFLIYKFLCHSIWIVVPAGIISAIVTILFMGLTKSERNILICKSISLVRRHRFTLKSAL